eukprot:GHVU01014216.1.p1 GENE.GHVU01014216.1~~GHVU01014216.1.p1  ORF type:complete len:291 (-),score=60.57 GHVU01014216.1:100-972(-)
MMKRFIIFLLITSLCGIADSYGTTETESERHRRRWNIIVPEDEEEELEESKEAEYKESEEEAYARGELEEKQELKKLKRGRDRKEEAEKKIRSYEDKYKWPAKCMIEELGRTDMTDETNQTDPGMEGLKAQRHKRYYNYSQNINDQQYYVDDNGKKVQTNWREGLFGTANKVEAFEKLNQELMDEDKSDALMKKIAGLKYRNFLLQDRSSRRHIIGNDDDELKNQLGMTIPLDFGDVDLVKLIAKASEKIEAQGKKIEEIKKQHGGGKADELKAVTKEMKLLQGVLWVRD